MRLWNCADLESADNGVLDSFPKGRLPRRAKALASSTAAKMTVRVAVIAMAVTFSMPAGTASRAEVFLPVPGVKFAQSLQHPTPLVTREFSNRFDDTWTQQQETDLLSLVDLKRESHLSGDSTSDEYLNSIYSNQNEDPEEEQGKLSLDKIKSLLSRRRRG